MNRFQFCGMAGTETFTDGEAPGRTDEDDVCTSCGEEDPDYVPETSEDPEEPETPSVPSTPVKPSLLVFSFFLCKCDICNIINPSYPV